MYLYLTQNPDWLVEKLRMARRKIDVAREVCRVSKATPEKL